MTQLVRYEQARTALAECARVDEVAEIRDKAAALVLYAKQRKDRELLNWAAEIQIRADQRFGELSLELERAPPVGFGAGLPNGGKTKAEMLADVGVSTSEAHRCEELAGGRDEAAKTAVREATERYFGECRETGEAPTRKGFREALREEVEAALGPPPPKRPKPAPLTTPSVGSDWIDWTAAVKHLAKADADLASLAVRAPVFHSDLLAEVRAALPRLTEWLRLLELSTTPRGGKH